MRANTRLASGRAVAAYSQENQLGSVARNEQ
jgi:hypothetical protein